ncbi:MAG: arginine deiminase-related protein [Actinomycetota bacterium]|nr:arginine deiminase-related protein [Actinomycetota bacterium]
MSETLVRLDERSEARGVQEPPNSTRLSQPAFLMCPPFSYSTAVANNPWMEELEAEKRQPDLKKALTQFTELYRYMASEGLVFLLPTPQGCTLQDLVFTANLGVVLEHLESRDTVVLSNFTSEPRRGETAIGKAFFESMGYQTHISPAKFEGDAELKHLHDNIYVGGYGVRSERETYDWMERTFGMEVVKLRLTDSYLYHLDCSVFPITRESTLVCTELFEKEEISELEKHTEVIDVSVDDAFTGICNSIRVANTIVNSSHIHELKVGTDDYRHEVAKNRRLEDIAAEMAFEVNYFNLSEYHKGGALLSCMVMHLNRYSYEFQLT